MHESRQVTFSKITTVDDLESKNNSEEAQEKEEVEKKLSVTDRYKS